MPPASESAPGPFGPGDGCTLWFDGWFGKSWRMCCDIHDLAYEAGIDRLVADQELRDCVAQSGAILAGVIAFAMYAGVRTFGWIFFKKRSTDR